ncbi:MAG: aspartyl/asparaginyl beta-hydroxylase domain-containing protein [Flavobacteriaceae bacterium]
MRKTPTISHLKLPFQFEEKKLVHDLNLIFNMQWTPIHYVQNYKGGWKSIALYAPDGNASNTFTDNFDIPLKPTHILKSCHYLKEVILQFKSKLLSVRLLRLMPNSQIKPHTDHMLGYENNNFRIHIPITTNDQITFTLNNQELNMQPGECWYTNVNFIHSVFNKGKTDRVHLVIDLERNEWSDELFFSLAPKESFAISDEVYSKEVLTQMIFALEKNDTPAAKKLVITYKEKLIKMS